MTARALVAAIDGMAAEQGGDELFEELENAEYKEAFELFDKVSRALEKAIFTNVIHNSITSLQLSSDQGDKTGFDPKIIYRDEINSLQIQLSSTQTRPGRAVKERQEQNSPNHVQRINLISVFNR